ncbi:MAG: hypothetical protein AAGD32_01570 [Planctomycetota bacterium]
MLALLLTLLLTPTTAPAFDIVDLLGRSDDSAEVTAFVERHMPTTEISRFGEDYYLLSPEAGVNLFFANVNRTLTNVELSNGYAGPMPNGVRWEMTRREVERAFGPPPMIDVGVDDVALIYPNRKLHLNFPTDALTDGEATLEWILLFDHEPMALGEPTKPRLQFRLVQPEDDDAEPMTDPGTGLNLAVGRNVHLDERDLASVQVMLSPHDDRPLIAVRLTPEAGEKFKVLTAEHVDRQLALVLDGEIIFAPTIRSPLGDTFVIESGGEPDVSDVRRLAGQINAARFALPE